jgi:hypothetical protein
MEISEEPEAMDIQQSSPWEPCQDHTYHTLCHCCCHQKELAKEWKDNVPSPELAGETPNLPKPKIEFANRYVKNDKATRLNTGLPNKAAFHRLFQMLEESAKKLKYWRGTKQATNVISSKAKRSFSRTPKKFGPKRKLSLQSEFLLL